MRKYFIDTNVVVYANDRSAGAKQTRAIEVLTTLMRAQNGVVSIQVLQEYANTALTKLNQDVAVVLRQLKLLEALTVVVPSDRVCPGRQWDPCTLSGRPAGVPVWPGRLSGCIGTRRAAILPR